MTGKHFCALLAILLPGFLVFGAAPVTVRPNGSVEICFVGHTSFNHEKVVFGFGLPKMPATKTWREGEVFRMLWITNGIRYTETIFVVSTALRSKQPASSFEPVRVLIVDIEGDNTNSEYTEAAAQISLTIGTRRPELELKDGAIWRLQADSRSLVAGFDIPGSGIRVSHGEVLQFSGNMPPSLKGSMTLKVPLDPVPESKALELLADLELEAVLRPALKSTNAPLFEFRGGPE